jgi:hypothetical protein
MSIQDLKLSTLKDELQQAVEHKGWDIVVRRTRTGYEAIILVSCEDNSDMTVTIPDVKMSGHHLNNFKAKLQRTMSKVSHTGGQIRKMSEGMDFWTLRYPTFVKKVEALTESA